MNAVRIGAPALSARPAARDAASAPATGASHRSPSGATPPAGAGSTAAGSPATGSNPPAPSAKQSAAASAGPSHPGATRAAMAGGKPDGAASSESAATQAAAKRDATLDGTDRDDTAPGDFAAVLAASLPADAPAAIPLPAAAVPVADTADPAGSDAALPDQLLALLSGSWALPASRAATSPPPTAASSHAGGAGGPLPLPTPPAAAAAAATAFAATGNPPFAALAALAAGALASTDRPGGDPAPTPADAPPAPDPLALTGLAATAASPRVAAPPPTAPLALPADPDAGFDDGFGARIAWMAGQRIGHAQIRLNPEHVGPIDVRVQLDGNRVGAEFSSANAEVRQAIEASLPRLREMLGQHGLQLGQADVGQGQSGRRDRDPMLGHGHDPSREAELDPRLTTMPVYAARGLLDEYA